MKKSEKVSKYLEDLIISGELKADDKLPSETKLAEDLMVSRVSVRAGIAELSAKGLLEKKQGGGTFVKKLQATNYLSNFLPTISFDQLDYREMLEFRSALDGLSVELCIKNLTKTVVDQLELILKQMENKKESILFFELDKQFHLTISQASQNSLIHGINVLIWDVLENHAKDQYHLIDNERRIVEHQLIVESIIQRDLELASIYTNRHLFRTLKDVETNLRY